MKDEDKTREQLINELAELRQRIAELEASETERKRVEEALRRSLQEAETLRQTAVALTSTLDLEEALDRILEQLHRVVAYDSASVELLRDDHLEIVGRRGFADPLVHIGLRFPVLGDNPHTCVIESGEPVILADTQAAQAPFRKLPHEHFRSWLGVPMRFRERIIGVIALDSREPDHFTAEHARLAATFANQAAIAIENARLYQNEQKRAAQLAVVNQVARRAASILNMDQLLQE
jgi:GAF domain-containing protein